LAINCNKLYVYNQNSKEDVAVWTEKIIEAAEPFAHPHEGIAYFDFIADYEQKRELSSCFIDI